MSPDTAFALVWTVAVLGELSVVALATDSRQFLRGMLGVAVVVVALGLVFMGLGL